MDGYSGAEITAVCRESGIISLNENLQNTSVTMDHLLSAISLIQPRTPPHLLKIYDRFSNDI